jgi:hypothetical protein
MLKNLGAKPKKADPRDYPAAPKLPATTVTGRKLWDKPIQLDQGRYGTCVANAWTHLLTDTPIEHPEKTLLDPEKQPSYAKLGSSAYWCDSQGNYTGIPVAAEKYAVKLYDAIHDGIIMPLDPERDDGAYTQEGATILLRRGLISSYYRVASPEAVIQAVLTHGPVVFASPWYLSMDDPKRDASGTSWCDVDPGTTLRGYHAYVIDGADNTGSVARARIHNSWGIFWGNKGSAWVTLDELRVLWMNQAFIAEEVAG